MARLMEAPNATSKVATDASALWELAQVFHQPGSELDIQCLYAFEELVKLTLGHLISTKDQDRSRNYLESFHARLTEFLAQEGISSHQPGTRYLVKASLPVFWFYRRDLLKPLKEKAIMKLRKVHIDGLISDLINKHESRAQRTCDATKFSLLLNLDGMLEYGDLLKCHERKAEGKNLSPCCKK